MQSLGGEARAKALTDEQKTEIAKKAAAARWNYPRATHEDRPLKIGDMEIPCAVLEGGIRVLSERAITKALGGKRGGSHWLRMKENPDGAKLPVYLSANNLRDYIDNELATALQPVVYLPKQGGKAFGMRAEMLPKICNVFLKARDAGALRGRQKGLARQADILMRGLAEVGIIALVDEATGYQTDRAKLALAEILEKFIAKELRGWTSTFPLEFYQHIFRLKGWPFDPSSMKRPGVIGHYTNDIVYKRLAPSVLKTLRDKNPKIDGRRKHKLFQWLTGDIGDPKLRAHLESVTTLMRVSNTWDEFYGLLKKAYRTFELAYAAVLIIVDVENSKYKETKAFLEEPILPGQLEETLDDYTQDEGLRVANLYDYNVHIFIKELTF